jgi:PIN domain nuclease of toxin-antitoxin system
LRADVSKSGFVTLTLTVEHILATELLPLFHRDPFDRALIAQAKQEGATLITRDFQFAKYDVPLIPA